LQTVRSQRYSIGGLKCSLAEQLGGSEQYEPARSSVFGPLRIRTPVDLQEAEQKRTGGCGEAALPSAGPASTQLRDRALPHNSKPARRAESGCSQPGDVDPGRQLRHRQRSRVTAGCQTSHMNVGPEASAEVKKLYTDLPLGREPEADDRVCAAGVGADCEMQAPRGLGLGAGFTPSPLRIRLDDQALVVVLKGMGVSSR